MIPTVIAPFLGCLAALIALAEISHPNKLIRYGLALLLGLVVAILLSLAFGWITSHL
jgi:hypothetical protein